MQGASRVRLSSIADYAVVLMAAAARHCGFARLHGRSGARASRLSATDLAEETGIPLPTAQKLVSLLTRAGLLKSARGAGGGITLARPSAAISLADIIEAVEGPIAMTNCVDTARRDCSLESHCAVQPHWNAVNTAIKGALGNVSLASLAVTPVPEASV
jgi:FeS assembly SUF system regulator